MSAPTAVSLFAGIGGFDLGLERAGFRVVAQVENDAFCQRILSARWPETHRWSDVRDAGVGRPQQRFSDDRHPLWWRTRRREERNQPSVDLLVGGFPCQDLSVAGKRAGLGGLRSSLFYEYVRIAKALAPTFGLVENVPGLLSSHRGSDMALVIAGLRECWPVVGWRILDSQHFGVAQRRRRVYFIGGPTEASVAEILALTEGGGGDSAAGGQTGADVAACLSAGAHRPGVNDPGRRHEDDVNLIVGPLGGRNDGIGRRTEDDPNLVVGPLRSNAYNNSDPTMEVQQLVTHALTADGHDASEDGTGRGTPLVVAGLSENQRAELRLTDYSRQITSGGRKPGQGYPAAMIGSSIRRLTPVECERLQGFPDGWTCLCQPLSAYAADPDGAALACRCPDSPRYRALGNAVTVPVIHWLGERLCHAMVARREATP